MHPQRKKRLTLIIFMVLGLGTAVGLLMYSLSQNINLFMTPTQIANGEAPVGRTMRAGGLVVDGSVERDTEGEEVVTPRGRRLEPPPQRRPGPHPKQGERGLSEQLPLPTDGRERSPARERTPQRARARRAESGRCGAACRQLRRRRRPRP